MHASLVQLVVGLGVAWIANLLIAKSNSLRSALKSQGWGCLSPMVWTKLITSFHKRNCPGKGILLLHPFRNEALLSGPIFPFKGMIGHYFGKFARMSYSHWVRIIEQLFSAEYRKYGSSCLSSVVLWDSRSVVWTADPDVFRVASWERPTFIKDVEAVR
jgi:hypothetical protein